MLFQETLTFTNSEYFEKMQTFEWSLECAICYLGERNSRGALLPRQSISMTYSCLCNSNWLTVLWGLLGCYTLYMLSMYFELLLPFLSRLWWGNSDKWLSDYYTDSASSLNLKGVYWYLRRYVRHCFVLMAVHQLRFFYEFDCCTVISLFPVTGFRSEWT